MSELRIDAGLVGRKVFNPTRPEWGAGTVLRVQSTTVGGEARHRVSVQFAVGHRVLHVPPARLTDPGPQAQREAGWLAAAAGSDLDGRLRGLPDFVREFLGTPRQRVAMLAPLFACDESPAGLVSWARSQTRVADPLSLWSRDELGAAFREFCRRRDQQLRVVAAELDRARGAGAVQRALAAIESPLRERMEQVLEERR